MSNYLDGWKRIVDFEGRSTRTQFWTFFLVNWAINLVLTAVLRNIFASISWILSIILFIAELSICIRRLHDTKRSGWNLLWFLLPLIGWIILLVFWLQPSK